MTKTATIRQILSDSEQGLLPYLRYQLETNEFAHFRSQFVFQAEESSTDATSSDRASELNTVLSISLKFSIIVDPHISADDAMILALEFQEMIDSRLVEWSKQAALLSPVTHIDGTFGRLEEVRYHGGFLPGFSIERQFHLNYKTSSAADEDGGKLGDELYRPGEIVPESGIYELTGPRGGSKGQEVTATKGEPFPPAPEAGLRYKLVIPAIHKNS